MQVEQFNVKDIGKPFVKAGDKVKDAGGKVGKVTKDVGGKVVKVTKDVGGFLGGILGKIWGFLKTIFKNWKSVLSIVCCVCFLSVAGPFIAPLLGLGRAASSMSSMIGGGRPSVRYNNR